MSKKDNRTGRRIFAEDPSWNVPLVPCLSKLCLQTIMKNFEKTPIFNALKASDKDEVQERLSTSLPLTVTANLIPDGVYWKRCCEGRWDICDVSHYGHSWKRMFFERHIENMIEHFIPEETRRDTVLEMVPLCKNFVKRLEISQLLPPIRESQDEGKGYGFNLESRNVYNASMNHFNFNILLSGLKNLEELHLVSGVKQHGMLEMFALTDRDCKCLAKALKSCRSLKLFRLYVSHIDDNKCQILVKQLLHHPSLIELDFSHNLIRDNGAIAVAELLTKSKLQTLTMYDNKIGDHGAKAIANSLSKNSTLLSLNLRLNHVGDEGGQAMGKALMKNNTLLHLNLGGNVVTEFTAIALAKMIAQNKTLRSINLSCNNLGVDGGKTLEAAMSSNTTLAECDVRLTNVEDQSASFINKAVWTNERTERRNKAKKEICKNDLEVERQLEWDKSRSMYEPVKVPI
ncbi:dynein regulatory complex subunit 5-like [Cheilinus undulatus]|uniref:dynein regulatory complex subunit 5-like n=1 Tax=Cheilinus undulatus TaxID=241271 RepID=UPI001BD3A38F|nr:dynein regulatory complex subunit 5-like [Cheilinus undulatus]